MDTLHEDVSELMITSRWILLRMRNVLDKSCSENQNTSYETVWKNLVWLDSPKMLL